jgi:hypothetical protein
MTASLRGRHLLCGTAVIALTVMAGPVPAGAAPAAATTSAEQIVEKHVAARGGLQKIRAIQTLRESGRMTEGPNREALVTRELKRPAQSRFEITLQGVTGVFVSDGTKGWKINPFDGDF